jgi:hypothetical protein
MLEKDLNMTEQQKTGIKKMREDHFAAMRPLFDSAKNAKAAYFGLVKDSTASDSVVNAYGNKILAIQSQIDKMTFAHFRSVRTLLNDEQRKKYDDFIQKMMQRQGRKDSSRKEK